jgi:integrase
MGTRRGNREGSINKRRDGRWEARLTLENGQRKTYYGRTRQEVQQKLAQAQRDLAGGLPIVGERLLVSQFMETWLETAKHRLKASAYRRYRTNLRVHILPALGRVSLAKLTAQQVQHLYTQKLNAGLSASTVLNIHTVLHSALNDATRMGLVQRNVADIVQKPRRRRTKQKTLSEAGVRTFLSAIRGDRLEALYILALSTGLREGELLGLSWSDVDLERGMLQVRQSLQESDGSKRYVLDEPKTSHSRRRVALSKRAIDALDRHRECQAIERETCGQKWDGAYDLVFPNLVGRPIHPSHLRARQFPRVLERAGLPSIRFHDLRHTAATLLLKQGVNPKIVSGMLGHANISITLDTYSHVIPDMQAPAVSAMNQLLGSGIGEKDRLPREGGES